MLLFTLKAQMKRKASYRIGEPLKLTTQNHMHIGIKRTFEGCNEAEDNVWNVWIKS